MRNNLTKEIILLEKDLKDLKIDFESKLKEIERKLILLRLIQSTPKTYRITVLIQLYIFERKKMPNLLLKK